MLLFFLSSGLFLGWSLGANDAANVFGTAVGTRMLRFRTAALICSIFVVLGAVIGGAGASHTLGSLGAVNALAGSFVVALSAALTVFWMTKMGLPVSTSQAIVGAIIGWNLFSGTSTDYHSPTKIVSTWVVCPFLSGVFAVFLYKLMKLLTGILKPHLLKQDLYLRLGLLLVGAFGSYSLGANNIANVMGVFVPVSPFPDLNLGLFTLTGTQQLFLLGSLAIAAGVYTYSRRVMATVGGGIFHLSPETALVVVLSESLVLFLFSSTSLESWLLQHGLPTIPLVPVSSSQAVVGAVLGIGLIKGGRSIRFSVMGGITSGWVTTPVLAGILSFLSLFVFQNVFNQEVSRHLLYDLSPQVIRHLEAKGLDTSDLAALTGTTVESRDRLQSILTHRTKLNKEQLARVLDACERGDYYLDQELLSTKLDPQWFTSEQSAALKKLAGKRLRYRWELIEELQRLSPGWRFRSNDSPGAKEYNKDLRAKLEYLFRIFLVPPASVADTSTTSEENHE